MTYQFLGHEYIRSDIPVSFRNCYRQYLCTINMLPPLLHPLKPGYVLKLRGVHGKLFFQGTHTKQVIYRAHLSDQICIIQLILTATSALHCRPQ